jgi:diguanylate cyclase (GGDEF)-like protein
VTQHVVIVDDDDLTLKLFAGIAAEIPDVVVHPFLSSTEAIDWYHGKEVDCFIFDYNMPLPNGMQMIALVRALPEFAHVPIVIVTGAHERDVRYQALDTGATDFLQKPVDYREMVARLTTLLALHSAQKKLAMQIDTLSQSLLDSEERSREHAERLEALWGIANNPNLSDEELMLAMLQRGAAAIRPGQSYRGVLARVENGTHMRIISMADALGYESAVPRESEGEGALVLLSDTVAGRTMELGGGTHAFDDIQTTEHFTEFVKQRAWRAMIVTTFTAGGATYVLAFASRQPATKPFGPQDKAYIEVLASFFAAHYQQRWQSTRLGHQLEHDSLTGLWNRSRFRSLGRAAFGNGESAAIAVVNLAGFHALNETHGHLTGDALLVEAAASLATRVQEGEIIARTGGNSFAIFLPNTPSRDALDAHVARFGAAFDDPIGIGDREGKHSVHVSARIAVAHAPHDGATFDDLLLFAEGRARSTGSDYRVFPVTDT